LYGCYFASSKKLNHFKNITLKNTVMKKLSFLLLTIIAILAVSCKKDTQQVSSSGVTADSQKVVVAANAWKVSSFIEKGVDQTADFNTYLFQFNSDGSAVANSTGIGILYYGSWSLMQGNHSGYDDSGNHSSGDENKLIISLSGNHHMEEISEDWKIIKLTSSEMWLKDDNTTSPKEIRFTRN
jgi:hypothetical protein